MKVFWALVAVLVLGAAVMAVRSAGGPTPRAERLAQADRTDEPLPSAETPPAAPSEAPAHAEPAPEPPPEAATTEPPASIAPEPAVAPDAPAANPEPAPDAAAPEPVSDPLAEPEPAKPAPDAPLPAELEQLVAGAIGNAPAPAPAAGAPAPDGAPLVAEQPDGSKLIAGRFILKGEGTREKPYEVTWDMLVAAQETYKPRLGQKTLPPFLDMLHGKFVTVSGFIAFPLMAQSADEMLVMLNQWDGCCIGIPPTPYDAVEVRLATAAEGETRFKVTGSVTGKFAVDPYLVKDWLIGLYTMEDAELTTN